MALDVGELLARLTVDNSQFLQGTQAAQSAATQATGRINQSFQGANQGVSALGTTAQQVARQLAQVQLSQDLDQQAQRAAQRLADLRTNAQQAGQSASDIAMNQSLIRDAQQAANQIEAMRRTADLAARSANDIQLQSALQSQIQGANTQMNNLQQNANQAATSVGAIGTAAGAAVSGMARVAGGISSSAGNTTAGSFLSGFSDKLGSLASKTGPIAGSLLGVAVLGLAAGAALAGAIQQGMEGELKRDLFQAQTKTTEAQARKFALAAGESFADAFGESVEGNLNTLKIAIQNNILDPGATQRDAEMIINSLETVSAAMETDVGETARAVGALVTNKLVKDPAEAMDLLSAAVGGSANKMGDLIEVVAEYGSGWKNTGLTAQMTMALIEQSTDNGADSADRAGDSLREFGRRITEEGDTIVAALNDIGLNGEELFEIFKKGGPDADKAFDTVFDKIRAIEDPVKRNTAAMALLGDTAGDFIGSLAQWDPSEAANKFGTIEGKAAELAGIIGGNAATSVQGAMNSISVAATGVKEALAEAFGPYIQKFADTISNNRSGVIQFFIDVGNAGFELAKSITGWVAEALISFGGIADGAAKMAAGVIRSIAPLAGAMDFFNNPLGLPGIESTEDKFNEMADSVEKKGGEIKDTMNGVGESIKTNVLPVIDDMQTRFNNSAGAMKLSAEFNDQSAKVAKGISEIGINADGTKMQLENWTGAIDRNNNAQVMMEQSIKGTVTGLTEQIKTGLEAGNTVESLTGQYQSNYTALLEQLTATGMNKDAAVEYLRVLGLTPDFVSTTITQPGMPEAKYELDVLTGKTLGVPNSKTIHTEALTKDAVDRLTTLGFTVERLPDGTVNVIANTDGAEANMNQWISRPRNMYVLIDTVRTAQAQRDFSATGQYGPAAPVFKQADGSVRTRANGMLDTATITQGTGQGITTRTPLGPVRYAERETLWEAYIPGAPSKRKRSEQILAETARRFGFGLIKFDDIPAMAEGGVVESMEGIAASKFPQLLQGGHAFSSYRSDGSTSYHNSGQAADFSNGSGNTDDQLAFANYMADNYKSQLAELIYIDPRFGRCIKDGEFVPDSFYAGAGDHTNHVHVASKTPLGDPAGTKEAGAPAGPDNRTEREKIADQVIAEGKRRGISDKGIKAAVMTALAETDLQNLDYGMDGDNAGIMQQRDNGGWGTLEDRKDPTRAAGMFYDKLDDFDYNSMTEAQAAQRVQQSGTADGSNYAVKAAEADEIIAASNARGNGAASTVGTTDGAALATDGQRVYVTNWPSGSSSYSGGTSSDSSSAPSTPAPPAADSNVIWSGGFKMFANGGMNLPGQAGLYSDGADIVGFAEKGTGGESYIPHALSKRARSVEITKETARRFGYTLVPMEDGGLSGFGGYVGESDELRVPTTPNGRRAAAYNAAAFGVGAAFALASGFDADGKFTGNFNTSSNSSSQLEKQWGQLMSDSKDVQEKILAAIKAKEPINVQVDVNRDTGMANIQIIKGGM